MKFVQLKCPNCGGQLKVEEAEYATCIHCGYEFLIDKEQEVEIHNHYYQVPRPAPQPVRTPVKSSATAGIIVFIFIMIVGSVLLPFVFSFAFDNHSSGPVESVALRQTPISEPVRAFCQFYFRKNPDQLTAKEFATIKYLKVERGPDYHIDQSWLFSYSLQDYKRPEFEDSVHTIRLASKERVDAQDFQCFVGLTKLDLAGSSDISFPGYGDGKFSLRSLPDLTSYCGSFNQSLGEMVSAFANPDKVTELSIQLRSPSDFEALLRVPGLQSLEIGYVGDEVKDYSVLTQLPKLTNLSLRYPSEISWLSTLPALTHLELQSGYSITDYSCLYGMPKLESLKILSSSDIKNIDFVKNMPNLHVFWLKDSDLLNLDALKGKISLLELKIGASYDMQQADALATLTSLQSLDFTGYWDYQLPDLSGLTNLRKVSLLSRDLSAISGMQIEELTLELSNDFDCENLLAFPALKTLSLSGDDLVNSQALTQLTALQSLTLQEVYDYTLSTHFFQHPSLENLHLIDIRTMRIDTTDLAENTVLRSLIVEKSTSFSRYENGEQVASSLGIGNFPELLAKLTGLTHLELLSAKLTDLEFAANLKSLEYLDISDNYIADVSPLVNLPKLTYLLCGNNNISNLSLLTNVHILQQ